MFFSIIIPVYNAEKNLRDTLDSVIAQDYKNYELILVNDGSIDNSWDIIKDYESKYSNIKGFSNKNGGASSARNFGITKASGEYLIFLDSDDTMIGGSLKKIRECINNDEDAIIVNYITHSKSRKINCIDVDTKRFLYCNDSGKSFDDVLNEYMKLDKQLPWTPYQVVFKNNLIRQNNIKFDLNYSVGEDADFFLRASKYVRKFFITDTSMVRYNLDSEGSLNKTYSYINLLSQLKVFEKYYRIYSLEKDIVAKKYFADRFSNIVILAGYLKNAKDRRSLINLINDNVDIIQNTTKKSKYKILKILINLIGIKGTILSLGVLRKLYILMKKGRF